MRISGLTAIVAGIPYLLLGVTPAFGLPVMGNVDVGGLGCQRRGTVDGGSLKPSVDMGTCSSRIEGLLAMRRWTGGSQEIFQEQKKYLAENGEKLADCEGFGKGSVEECVSLGKESSKTLPEAYINHICQLLH
ncbi:hypothetical protein TWF718_006654 [Orbilia javanica]|uniref:Uncharacterized protein n=1 Tax=Orbilia javanica TaxID=47235 RepID=A0AAN8RHK2_9PEZI